MSDRHPITLEQIVFVRCSVIAVPGYQAGAEESDTAQPTNEIAAQPVPGEPGRFSASMRTLVNPKADISAPYSIDMECMAVLTADLSLESDEAHRGVLITAHSVLYGAIRETVAWLTGRQPYGPLMLGLSILRAPQKPPSKEE